MQELRGRPHHVKDERVQLGPHRAALFEGFDEACGL